MISLKSCYSKNPEWLHQFHLSENGEQLQPFIEENLDQAKEPTSNVWRSRREQIRPALINIVLFTASLLLFIASLASKSSFGTREERNYLLKFTSETCMSTTAQLGVGTETDAQPSSDS